MCIGNKWFNLTLFRYFLLNVFLITAKLSHHSVAQCLIPALKWSMFIYVWMVKMVIMVLKCTMILLFYIEASYMVSLCCHYLTIEFTVVPRKFKKCVVVVFGGSMCFFTVRDLYTYCNTNPIIFVCK